jgi:hypothetical protein
VISLVCGINYGLFVARNVLTLFILPLYRCPAICIVAGGGSPMNCDFSVAGEICGNTCTGRPNIHPDDDPNYHSFKEIYTCIGEKCIIQLGHCQNDPVCEKCFAEDEPDYCYNIDAFNAVIDCAMCSCTERKNSVFCGDKSTPGTPITPANGNPDAPKQCSPAETIKGSSAVIAFSKCTDFDQVGMMVSEFDQNNFGQLDAFEACSHSFTRDPNHGGHTALGCMQILSNAITNPTNAENANAPKEAIAALANFLYHDAEHFCTCASNASEDCPQCPSFKQFKTLLWESLDACQSLDEIDCDSWNEFYIPCQANLIERFTKIDFAKKEQCKCVASCCMGGLYYVVCRLCCLMKVDYVYLYCTCT